MPIAFEGVSYSYADPARQEKRKSRAKRRREAGVIEDAPSLERGKPAWGGDPDAVWALRDITFELEDGEFLGIAGHTGSGKSTLIQHMTGLVSPTRGRVLLDGQDLADKRAAQACRGKVGLVFQYPEYQLFAATVREDVAFGPRNLGLSADEVERRVAAALETVYGPAPVAPAFAPGQPYPEGSMADIPDAADATPGVDLPGLLTEEGGFGVAHQASSAAQRGLSERLGNAEAAPFQVEKAGE